MKDTKDDFISHLVNETYLVLESGNIQSDIQLVDKKDQIILEYLSSLHVYRMKYAGKILDFPENWSVFGCLNNNQESRSETSIKEKDPVLFEILHNGLGGGVQDMVLTKNNEIVQIKIMHNSTSDYLENKKAA